MDEEDNPMPGKLKVMHKPIESLCGRNVSMEWCFVNLSHAYNTIDAGERYQVCPDCWDEAKETLEDGIWEK